MESKTPKTLTYWAWWDNKYKAYYYIDQWKSNVMLNFNGGLRDIKTAEENGDGKLLEVEIKPKL